MRPLAVKTALKQPGVDLTFGPMMAICLSGENVLSSFGKSRRSRVQVLINSRQEIAVAVHPSNELGQLPEEWQGATVLYDRMGRSL